MIIVCLQARQTMIFLKYSFLISYGYELPKTFMGCPYGMPFTYGLFMQKG
jgi:hypothetical protein